jgi:hypothetical protein
MLSARSGNRIWPLSKTDVSSIDPNKSFEFRALQRGAQLVVMLVDKGALTMKLLYSSLLLVLIVLSASIATANDPTPFYFGLSNDKGNQAIIYDNNANPPHKLYAISSSGGKCLLNFVEKRARKPGDTGRQTAKNFDNLGGVVFQASNECLTGDRTIVLIDPDLLDKHKPVPVKPTESSPLDTPDIFRVEALRKLTVKSSWNLASLDSDAMIALVQFFPEGNSTIASLVLVTKERIVFEDYAGNAKNINSVWRADDGGIFNPGDFQILAAFRSPHGLELIRAWAGPEGENSALLREDGGKFLKILDQYRYWAGL